LFDRLQVADLTEMLLQDAMRQYRVSEAQIITLRSYILVSARAR
jgi:hypothetical protein